MYSNLVDLNSFSTVNQEQPHARTSSRYSFIPTTAPLSVLADFGWFPAKVMEATTRRPDYKGYQKHIVRLRHKDFSEGTDFPEVVLKTSHLGLDSFDFMAGYFRCVCLNGMIVGNLVQSCKVRHVGYTAELVASALKSIVENMPRVIKSVDRFKSISLSRDEERVYGRAAIDLRFDANTAVDADRVLTTRRFDDKKNDLWTVFNRVQENLIRGGVRTTNAAGHHTRSRGVKSIDENVRLNKALWTLTEKMADLRQVTA